MSRTWKSGDWAVYRKSKRSASPGRRAAHVMASTCGETYGYVVDKFWVVEATLPGGRLRLRTARGKIHLLDADDPNLRKPNLVQRLLWRERFRTVEQRLGRAHFAA